MTKRELFSLMQLVREYYEQFEFDQAKLDAWYLVLKEEDFACVRERIVEYVARFPNPPRVSELMKKNTVFSRAVPDLEETEANLVVSVRRASAEVVRDQLAKMREILGIRRG